MAFSESVDPLARGPLREVPEPFDALNLTNPELAAPKISSPQRSTRNCSPSESFNRSEIQEHKIISMGNRFHDIAFTDLVKAHQQEHGSRRQYERMAQGDASGGSLSSSEETFLSMRDSFYMASVSETGWPYIQHRGGAAGFVKILAPELIGFADLRGNKQYISIGNLEHDARVALFFMDYPNQTRLKILGRVEIHENDSESVTLIERLRTADPKDVPERAILIHVEGFDWNCPQHITPRYTVEELQPALRPLQDRLAALEAKNAELRATIKG